MQAHKSEVGMETALIASAKKHPDYRYLLIDSKANAQALSFFGLAEQGVPAYVVHDAEPDDKYLLPKAKPSDLDSFLAEFQVSVTAAREPGCWLLLFPALALAI